MPFSASLKAAIASASSIRQSLWTVPSSSATSPHGARVRERLDGRPGRVRRVVVEAEDRGEVRARRARETQPVLLRARVRALVRADPARAVVLDLDAREDAVARARLPVGARVVLRERPQRGRLVAHDDPLVVPAREHARRMAVRICAVLGQVDLDHVVRRTAQELRSLGRVDHVIGRRGHRLQATDLGQVVVKGVEGFDVGHLSRV